MKFQETETDYFHAKKKKKKERKIIWFATVLI